MGNIDALAASYGGGRGIYCHVDGDLPVAARTNVPAQAVAHRPLDTSDHPAGASVRHAPALASGPSAAVPDDGPSGERPTLQLDAERFDILHANVQGLCSSLVELVARLRSMSPRPALVCLNETWLDKSIGMVELEGYDLIARRDRRDGRKCGGVIVFARSDISARCTLLEESVEAERVWVILHSTVGPYLVCAWYRPPHPGEVASIVSLREELGRLSVNALGSVIVGDINVHHKSW